MDVMQIGKEFYCSVCLKKFSKRYNAQRHYQHVHAAHAVSLQGSSKSTDENNPSLGMENDNSDSELFDGIDSFHSSPEAPDLAAENNIDQLLLDTLENLQTLEEAEEDSSSSDNSDNEEDELSIEDEWVFPGSKLSIKEHASSVLGIELGDPNPEGCVGKIGYRDVLRWSGSLFWSKFELLNP